VMPSEYYREVLGGEMADACKFGSLDEAHEILGLMMRHWNTIASALYKGEVYVPLLLEARTEWRTATTGLGASCGAWACATTAGQSWSTTSSTADA